MTGKPSSLINFGSKCYLNSGIQAISACPDFVDKIDKLSKEKKHLRKLTLFNGLIKSMNKGKLLINIANNDIFEDWTKSGQQDSFELLSHVLNEVYEELRAEKGVERGSVGEYFALGLPLRIQLKYDIICECGHKEGSPIQLDVALHLALPGQKAKNEVHIQDLLNNQFKKEEIDDFPCENSNCNGKITWRELRLLALPYSICIHLQRLFWNGETMVKNDVDVLFSNMIIIKSDCLKKTDDVQVNDVQYYLKSVIVHYGWASFGHYLCYKKVHDTWYYTSDTDIHKVTAQKVFSCNPYILFYEKESEWQVSPTIVEVDENLNMFINALSSKVFISWLNKISADNDSLMIKRLLYLTKLANGDITRDRAFEEAELKGWSNKKDVYGTARDIVNEVSEETAKMEFPLLFMVRCKITCSCGMVILNENTSDVMLDIRIPESLRHRMLKLQDLIDHHFSVNRPVRSEYMDHKCKQSLMTLKLKSPLPDMFCIDLHRWPGDECDDRIILDNNIFMRDSFIEEGEHNEYSPIKGREYFLKSVIGTCNGRMCCFRNYNGYFYKIERHNVDITAPEQSMDCDHCILFYDSDRCSFTASSSLFSSSTKYLQMSLDSSVKKEFKTMNVPSVVPVVIKINSHLNSFIHAISSCDHFIAELEERNEYTQCYNIERLLYLIKKANGSMKGTSDLEKYVKDWYDKTESVEGVMEKVLYDLNKNNDLFKYCTVEVTSSNSDLQMLINDENSTFSKGFTKTICVKVASTSSVKMTFTETMFFSIKNENIIQSKDVFVALQVKDQVFTLQSVITEHGSCYRKIKHDWYQVTKTSSKKVSVNDVLKCKAYILFYESQDLITFDKPLSCVLHSLSCCSNIIQWLNTMKNRKKMIKGRLISDMINIINGQTLDVTREKKVYRWNDDHFCDIYQLLKTVLTDLEEEIKAESEKEESTLTGDIHIPMRMTIEERIECYEGKGSISEIKNKVILNINLPKEINYKDKVTIQQLLEKYFEDEYKHSSLIKHKSLVEPYPSIIVIHVNIFYEKNGESLKHTNNVKPSEKIKIPTTLRTSEYKLKSVIEHYGKPSSEQYCCFKEINGEWVYVKDENVVPLSLKEVLEIEPYIAVYEVDLDSDNICNDNESKEPSNLYEASTRVMETYSVTTLRNSEAMVEQSLDNTCTSTLHDTTLQSTQPMMNPSVIISFEGTSNKTFSNFLRSILNCPKLITNMKSLIDKSVKRSKYDSLFNKVYELKEAQLGTLVIKDTQGPYRTDIEPFVQILSEYLSCNDLVQENSRKEWNFPLVIFNVGCKREVTESKWPIMFGVKISDREDNNITVESIQQMIDNYFELYSNPSSGIIMLQYKESRNQIKRLFQGRFPDTLCFHLSHLLMMTFSISKSFTLLIRNNLCQHSSTDNTKCSISTDGITSSCCRKMILKSVIDSNNECYVLKNDEWYINTESGVIQIIKEDDLLQKLPRILIYE